MLSIDQLNQIKFTNLVTRSHWSIPMGVGTIKQQMAAAAKKGLNGLGLTDINSMSGTLEAYKLSKDKEFKEKIGVTDFPLLLGVILNVTDNIHAQEGSSVFDLTAFATSKIGYKNLVYLTSISSDPNHYTDADKNRISIEELVEFSKDVIVGSGGINGFLSQAIIKETGQEEELIQVFKELFGDKFFIEIHIYPRRKFWNAGTKQYDEQSIDVQEVVNKRLIELSLKYDIKCCIVQNSYMTEEAHLLLQNILISNHPDYKKSGWHLDQAYFVMSVQKMYEFIRKNSPYITDEQFVEFSNNTQIYVDMVKNFALDFYPALPSIQYEEHQVNLDPKYEKMLSDLRLKMVGFCEEMVELIDVSKNDLPLSTTLKTIIRLQKIDWTNHEYVSRLAFEINTIQRNGVIGLLDYFLLLEDVTNFVVSIGKLRGFGRGCLTKESLVLTQKGYVNIDKVKVGDQVVSHTGKYQKVLKTFKYPVEKGEKLVKVYTQKSYQPITFTLDHKVYGLKRDVSDLWINASPERKKKIKKYKNFDKSQVSFDKISNFKEGDLLFLKTPSNRYIEDIQEIDLSKYVNNDESYFKVLENTIELYNSSSHIGEPRFKFKRYLPFDENLCYQIGKWIGYGWNRYNKEESRHCVGYAFNSGHTSEIEKTVSFYKSLGFDPKVTNSKSSKLTQVNINSKLLSEFFKDIFPDYENSAESKYIGNLKCLPNNKLTSLLKGLKSADGYQADYQGGDRRECIDTVSKRLLEDIRQSLMFLNIPSGVRFREGGFDYRFQCKVLPSYKIVFLGLELDRKGHQKNFIFDDGFFVKIKKMEEVSGIDFVYDINVDKDNSFATSEYTVHNSGGGSLLTYVMDISDCDPIKYGLLFERFLTKERIGSYNFEQEGYSFSDFMKNQQK